MSSSEFVGISVLEYWKIQVTLPYTTGLPTDVVTNTWHFVGEDPTDYTLAIGWLGTVYATIGPLLSTIVARTSNAATMKVYDLADDKPRPPVATQSFTVAAVGGGGVDLPLECALVGSYQAIPRAGVRQSSRRGRVYFGPWQQAASSTDYKRPDSSYTDTVRDALQALQTSSEASSQCRWAIYSPTLAGGLELPGGAGPPNLPGAVSPVDNGWVDNEWDTQRSRGREATSRDTFT